MGMEINEIIGKNLSSLRKEHGLTQREVAVKLDFSDKSVSKWESGESMPSVDVLVKLASLFGVKLDYFVTEEHSAEQVAQKVEEKPQKPVSRYRYSRVIISMLSILSVWIAATCVFVFVQPTSPDIWIVFVWALVASSAMAIVFNSIWGPVGYTFLFVSLFIWFSLGAIYLQLLLCGTSFWQLFLLGIPLQLGVVLSATLILKNKRKDPATIRARREYLKEKALQRKAKQQALMEHKKQQKEEQKRKNKEERLLKKQQKQNKNEQPTSPPEEKTQPLETKEETTETQKQPQASHKT